MPFFIDTSALFKRYQTEKGSSIVARILEDQSQPLYISSITIVEIVSNLKRLVEVDKITTPEQFQQQRDFFYKDIVDLNITILDITADDVIRAEALIMKRYMKPVDSIQLAVALNIDRAGLIFVSADQRLCKIAMAEGLKTHAP